MTKTCPECQKPVPPFKNKNAKFCSNHCRTKAYGRTYSGTGMSEHKDLATATVGALNELKTACYLMEKGFSVFRALSPSCQCDLAVLKHGQLLRIEVTTGYRLASGKLIFSKHISANYDAIAVVCAGDVIIMPELDILLTKQ